jgi:hypothetical protein
VNAWQLGASRVGRVGAACVLDSAMGFFARVLV